MKKRFKKTKRETLALLIIKTVVIASLICGAFAFIRWNMMCNVVSYQLTDKTDISYEANRIDSRKGNGDPLPELLNEMTQYAYTAVNVPDIYVPSSDEIISSILNWSTVSKSVSCVSSGTVYDTPGCYSVAVITDEAGNIIGENTERFIMNIWFREGECELYSFAENTSDDPEAASLFEELKNSSSFPSHVRYDIEVDSAYINRKTHEFIPCKFRIKNEEPVFNSDGLDHINTTSKEFSISVKEKDFEFIEFSADSEHFPHCADPCFGGEKQEDIDRILECFELVRFRGGISDTEKFSKLMEESDTYNEQSYSVYLNGEMYNVFMIDILKYKTPEFMNLFRKNVIHFSIIVFIIATLLCRHRYYKNKTKYALEDYERDLTNHLAHDMKTPLMAIGGYAENILDGKLTEEEKKEYLEAIIENVEFADSTMSRTLMLNSMDGNAGFKYETTDVGKVVSEAVKKYEPLLEQNNISFSLEGGATVKAESTSFEKIVENLISNAVKYTPENGSIKVMIDKNKMVISNTVNGKIDTRKLKEPFVRGEESRSNLGGSGLGLSIAERAAALNGFRLNISCTDNEFKAEVKF